MYEAEKKAIHFGAGNVGRGFIGPLLSNSGYHVVFSDVDNGIIHELNERNSYDVHILDKKEHSEPITHISGVNSQTDDVVDELADPRVDIVTTAVGPRILEKIAPTIAKGLSARRKANGGRINIIACENMVGQTAHLSRCVSEHLSPEDRAWVDENVGFANCSVDRIVPPSESGDRLDVGVEGFYEWVVDESMLKKEVRVNGMKLTKDLEGYIERKLFSLNCGHAICAYIGYIKGYKTIDEAIKDPSIHDVVQGALKEGGHALIKKHHFDPAEHDEYTKKIIHRFENPRLKDEVSRVGRQPLRKLGKEDRLLGPANMAKGYRLPIDNLTRGIAAAFLYDVQDDDQSVELQEKIRGMGIGKAVQDVIGWEEGSPEHTQVLKAHQELQEVSR
ncbi:hypothetical protein JAAARDRAFT_60110 [Jaapia argillacea MUCL 33604]|uniref:Mannitol-1-phosphate 5-dehydrogenase n=1 Tax=Jaapia argillacea MUCL 33604 TaxID=933084 RepID=A0A067PK28_9AGAM|nr:hypothetical protein JAAARDRAFT_60110 [Jaapia argillacea MUCL 33604]